MIWDGPTNNASYSGEMFRVELYASGVDLVWFDPNPHAGHEGGEHYSLADFVTHANAHDSIRRILGEAALAEIVAEVRRLLG
jgi:hypothetical protein